MLRNPSRKSFSLWRALGTVAAVLTATAAAAAPFVGLQHTAWTAADGAPLDISTLAQTADGYLWLGTGSGLFRFDGVRFERIVPREGVFPHADITVVLPMANGDLLLGYRKGGISRLSSGRLTNYGGFPSAKVMRIIERADKTIWVWSDIELARGGLRRLAHGRWQSVTAGLPADKAITGTMLDGQQALWVLSAGYFYKNAIGARFFSRVDAQPLPKIPPKIGNQGPYLGGLPLAADGSLWFVDDDAFGPLTGPARQNRTPLRQAGRTFFTRGGDFWISARDAGVQRVLNVVQASKALYRRGRPNEIFGALDGLTSNSIGAVLEDREGDIWVATNLGLDRFKPADVNSEPSIAVLARETAKFAPAPDGAFYVAQSNKVILLRPGRAAEVLKTYVAWFNASSAVCPAAGHSVWIGSQSDLRKWTGHVSQPLPLPPDVAAADLRNCREDSAGRLWLAVAGKGLFRRDPAGWRALAAVPPFDDHALLADDGSVLWEYADNGPLRQIDGDRIRSFDARQGLSVDDVSVLYRGAHGLLVGGESGMAQFDGERFRSLKSASDSPFRRITGIVQTERGETWLNAGTGIIRIASADLETAFRLGRWPGRYRLFDREDGLAGYALQDSMSQTALEGVDGRVWFVTNQGLSWIDPRRLFINPVVPPVIIQKVIAAGHVYQNLSDLKLPADTSSIEIDYTTPSLRTPERLAFRYRIEGVDADWVNPGRRRQAIYTRLGPGTFTFRVIAANDSGIWNSQGAALQFSIRPTITETWEFRLGCIVLAILALAGLMLLYVRQVAVRMRERLDERLRERERIARELHDTLLQGFQGLQLHFQSVVETIASGSPTRNMLERALLMTDAALVDARGRVRDLRGSGVTSDLPQHLRSKRDTLAGPATPALEVSETGQPRELDYAVEREIAAVAEEAIFNAIKHAGATRIEVCIVYSWRKLEITISDNGKGFNSDVLAGLAGKHFGIMGMRERVRRLRGKFFIGTGPQRGTEVKITIPGLVAYGAIGWLLDRVLKL